MKFLSIFILLLIESVAFSQKTYHVSPSGSDQNPGTSSRPLKTISAASKRARPGDLIEVHAGVYREMVSPERGGLSPVKRITYEAAPGEKVEIKGSETLTGWKEVKKGIWRICLPDSYFKGYNPYTDLVRGDWYYGKGLHTGEVYINGKCLHETTDLDKLLHSENVGEPVGVNPYEVLDGTYSWYCSHEKDSTVLYANFHGHDPGREEVEINVRPSCFYPAKTGVNYITVKGFEMSQAATQWAAPTAEQVGIIGTNWSKGWLIEDNIVHDSKCVGITLGKDRASGENVCLDEPTRSGSLLYNEMVLRVIEEGWNKKNIGSHLVQNNTIYGCGAAGICGSFGATYSRIIHNHIYDIYTFRPYWGAEMGGIKIHASIDVVIKGNQVHNAYQGIWLDWMAQGTRITGNLCYNNDYMDFFPEVDHGPYLVDNNLFLSAFSIKDWSEGGAYVHNLVAGMVSRAPQSRETPYFKPHTTDWVCVKSVAGGDNRFYNNIFLGVDKGKWFQRSRYMPPDGIDADHGYGTSMYQNAAQKTFAAGNLYWNGALPLGSETVAEKEGTAPPFQLIKKADGLYLQFSKELISQSSACSMITSAVLGKTNVSKEGYEEPDGTAITINTDYLGDKRNSQHPGAGPFEKMSQLKEPVKVW